MTTHASAVAVRESAPAKAAAVRQATPDYTTLRANMLEGQLRPHKVNQPQVLTAFAAVARENFAAPAQRALAYTDSPTFMDDTHSRPMFMPMVEARLIQALHLSPTDHVLVLAGGTGYAAAVCAHLAGQVTMQEHDPVLNELACTLLAPCANVQVVEGQPVQPAVSGPFDAILIDAAVGHIPAAVLHTLKEGGRLGCVREGQATKAGGLLDVVVLTKLGKTLFEDVLFETKATVLPELRSPERFVF